MKQYSPTGRRNHGRPLKRLPDTWDRNGSTSGPTPWQIYDDDDNDDDDNITATRIHKTADVAIPLQSAPCVVERSTIFCCNCPQMAAHVSHSNYISSEEQRYLCTRTLVSNTISSN
jgi:hypothetical protein